MEKIIQPWGWTGAVDNHDPFPALFEILDPYKLRHGGTEKVASAGVHPDILQFVDEKIGTVHPRDDRYVYILCSNMGAGETWGSNINADRFNRAVLSYTGKDWGVQTFLKSGIFKHHVNKDPKKSYGDIIYVTFAAAPLYMDRVESVVRLDRERAAKVGAEDVIQDIEAGQFPAWSMGARVPYDVCSYCGKKAKTRAQYCVHMKKYPNVILTADHMDNKDFKGMKRNQIGLRICVDNPRPKFFDFSRVWIGAAPEAKTLRKIASITQTITSAELAEEVMKTAATSAKSAAILKRVQDVSAGSPVGKTLQNLSDREDDIPNSILDAVASRGFAPALSTLTGMGMVLKPREFQRVVCMSSGRSDLADAYDRTGAVFSPSASVQPCHSAIAKDHFVQAFAHMLLSLVPQRSAFGPPLVRRMVVARIRPVQRAEKRASALANIHLTGMENIAGLYNGYRLALLEKVSEISAGLLHRFPEIAQAVYAGDNEDMFVGLRKEATALVDSATVGYLFHAHGFDVDRLIEQNPGSVAHYARRAAGILV